ncbi:MAG: hypothetical protein HY648_02725 [Acidobacteria bacterium]|nr:hypothetical protein [Acidobacteriota bacterium]
MKTSAPMLDRPPIAFFEYVASRLEIRLGQTKELVGLSLAQWSKIADGDWQKLVPLEFHSGIKALADLPVSESYAAVEFPVSWGQKALWLRVLAVGVPAAEGNRKVLGMVQDVTCERESPLLGEEIQEQAENGSNATEDVWQELRHKISAPLTSILLHCDLLLEGGCTPDTRLRVETILSEAARIDQYLREVCTP